MIVAIPLGLMSAIYPHPICAAAGALVAEADPRDPRRRADRRLRLFRRADRRAGGPRLRPVDRHQLGEQRKRARRRPGHGHHDHPVRQLDGRRSASPPCRRRCATAAWRWARPSRRRSARCCCPPRFPGVVGGVLLAVSRAIGETMIVVMAAGLAANLTANPFASVTTVTVADRPAADRRPGIRQRQDAGRLRARPGAVPDHAGPQPHRAARRAAISGSI